MAIHSKMKIFLVLYCWDEEWLKNFLSMVGSGSADIDMYVPMVNKLQYLRARCKPHTGTHVQHSSDTPASIAAPSSNAAPSSDDAPSCDDRTYLSAFSLLAEINPSRDVKIQIKNVYHKT